MTKKKELRERIARLEKLRPHWAQGFTDDSVAVQCATDALQALWDLLGVDNQTDAVKTLTELIQARRGG